MSTALSIGNFDGAHLGHAALIKAARDRVGPSGRVLLLSFDPHPATVLRPDRPLPLLSTLATRRDWLKELGADEVASLPVTREFLDQDPEAFGRLIIETYRPSFFVEGPDFRFGRNRAGNVETLRAIAQANEAELIVLDPVERSLADQGLVVVSSSIIRWLVGHGRVADAATLLGRPFQLEGAVVRGDQRGRTIGMPTANVDHGGLLLPADGIYAGHANGADGRWYPAAISVGTKPTFGTNPRVCEAHLVGYEGQLDDYGWGIEIRFEQYLRDQINYDGVEPLIAQLQRDLARTLEVVGAT